ncbi:protein-glutamate methylesterase/protein-glutamine glutaminase [Schlesneria paludicola]|uniref:protein-glutamate methylesterase/protein-glutamine glutaminase n=1 Tax=Schlesneria paludicola TaxID=360056 RepID=UPI00029B12FE|nr:chemotaxis response regulator protein-glutamate methylesterase [Schlesneria paludicola]
MIKIRVLIVDDSVVARKSITEVLSADSAIEVAGVAANGKIGIAKIAQVCPDVVILDVEMPGWNGLETLTEIRKLYARLPVIMFSAWTQRGASLTLDAFARGASDYVAKPVGEFSPAEVQRTLRDQLIPKIKALCPRFKSPSNSSVRNPEKGLQQKSASRIHLAVPTANSSEGRIDVVAMGVSTGGPNALCEILPAIPKYFPVPILIVQHMPANFTEALSERLNKMSQIRVVHGTNGVSLERGTAYIAPGDFHMAVKRQSTEVVMYLNQLPPENSCRPSVDVLFRSVVEAYGAGVLGVILTGMGQDGLRGCQFIREVGGQIIAQDEKSSVVWGMPGFVAKAGLADCVLPLHQIAIEIHNRVQKHRQISHHLEVDVCS